MPLASRLCWAARRAGEKLARADAGWAAHRRGNETDINEAIDVQRQAVDAVPPTAPTRAVLVAGLVTALVIRFRSRRDGA